MITLPLILLFGAGTFACYRFSDARVLHLITASIFGLMVGATPLGPEITAAVYRIAEAAGASFS